MYILDTTMQQTGYPFCFTSIPPYYTSSVPITRTCYPGQGWFARNLGCPGVPDKSSRSLDSMSRYSAQILICFIAYIFLFYSSAGLVGNFAGLLPCWCTMPSAIVHCSQNEAGHQTIKAASMPCCGATGPCKHSLAFMPLDWCNWQIKSMKSVSLEVISTRTKWMESFFAYLWVILLYFSLESRLISAVLELGQGRCSEK